MLAELTRWAFAELDPLRITLIIDVENGASSRVAERCGYVREGVMRSTHLKGDMRIDAGDVVAPAVGPVGARGRERPRRLAAIPPIERECARGAAARGRRSREPVGFLGSDGQAGLESDAPQRTPPPAPIGRHPFPR